MFFYDGTHSVQFDVNYGNGTWVKTPEENSTPSTLPSSTSASFIMDEDYCAVGGSINGAHTHWTDGYGAQHRIAGRKMMRDTFASWHLVPTEKPAVNPPGVRTRYVDVPGKDGQLDLTELQNGLHFNMRQGNWKFYINTDYISFESAYQLLRNYLHGRTHKVSLADDPAWEYTGRFAVGEPSIGQGYPSISVTYALMPHRQRIGGYSDWLWDPLNFEIDQFKDPVVTSDLKEVDTI